MWRPYGVSQRLDSSETIKLTNEAQTIRGSAASLMGIPAVFFLFVFFYPHLVVCVSVVDVALVSISVLWFNGSPKVLAVLFDWITVSVAAPTTTSSFIKRPACFFYGSFFICHSFCWLFLWGNRLLQHRSIRPTCYRNLQEGETSARTE